MLSYINLGHPADHSYRKVLDESQCGIAIAALSPNCVGGRFGTQGESRP